MPKKPSRKPKTRSRKPKPRQKQKQKQVQKVSVNVSGGGSGSGGFIPIPQAPSFDYAALANLIRPAATVDMPIVAQARPAPPIPMGSSVESRFGSEPIRESFSSSSAKTPPRSSSVSFEPSESESDVPFRISKATLERKQREMLREPIDVRGVSKETAKRAFEFSENPEQEFIISRPSRGGKSKSK